MTPPRPSQGEGGKPRAEAQSEEFRIKRGSALSGALFLWGCRGELFFLVDDDVGGTFVHDAGVIGADELTVEHTARSTVDGVAKDLSVAIDNTLFA